MASTIDDSDGLNQRARGGDASSRKRQSSTGVATGFARLVASRLDRRLAARIDPSERHPRRRLRNSAERALGLLPETHPARFCLSSGSVRPGASLAKLHRHHLAAPAGAASIASGRHRDCFRRRPRWAAEPRHPVAGGTSPSGRAIRSTKTARASAPRWPGWSEGDRKLLAMRRIESSLVDGADRDGPRRQ